jgi:hypothetical protein
MLVVTLNAQIRDRSAGADVIVFNGTITTHNLAITKKSPISPRENMHPTMVHGHEYEGAGELLRIELHDHENVDMPAIIIDDAKMRQHVEEDVTKLPKRSPKVVYPGAAWFMQTEHETGRIAPGNLADFALLSADYFTVPEDEIGNISSVVTVVGGRVVFGTRKYGNLARQLPEPIPAWSPRQLDVNQSPR